MKAGGSSQAVKDIKVEKEKAKIMEQSIVTMIMMKMKLK